MIKVYTGPMFSGKSDALLNDYENKYHKSKILLFKPKIDTRDFGVVKTRNGKEVEAILIKDLADIKEHLSDKITTIFIDEANFLKGDVAELLKLSVNDDLDIFIAGLNMTSEQKPFGIMPQILAVADEIVMMHASCNECNRDAIYTYYEGKKNKDILVGNEGYSALCARCLRKKLNDK
jgi:thymidine kinase